MKTLLGFFIFLIFVDFSTAGVMPSRSRIIYADNDREQTLMLANTNDYPVIVQSWVDTGSGNPDESNIPFVSIPPVARIETGNISSVRIMHNSMHSNLPKDRESLFWFNIYEVPPENNQTINENSVLVTMNTQIKLFFRPNSILDTPEKVIKKLHCKLIGPDGVSCHNPGPLHLSVIAAEIDSGNKSIHTKDGDLLINPFSDKKIKFPEVINAPVVLVLTYVDDYGQQLSEKIEIGTSY